MTVSATKADNALVYAQVDAGERDWQVVVQAVAVLRDHGELAIQRSGDLRRRRLNQVGPLLISVCRGCRRDRIGEATAGEEAGGIVGCEILIDLSGNERDARGWGLPVTQIVGSTLVHEQEPCVRAPTTGRHRRSTRSGGWP